MPQRWWNILGASARASLEEMSIASRCALPHVGGSTLSTGGQKRTLWCGQANSHAVLELRPPTRALERARIPRVCKSSGTAAGGKCCGEDRAVGGELGPAFPAGPVPDSLCDEHGVCFSMALFPVL